jgi:hypothetical protein
VLRPKNMEVPKGLSLCDIINEHFFHSSLKKTKQLKNHSIIENLKTLCGMKGN